MNWVYVIVASLLIAEGWKSPSALMKEDWLFKMQYIFLMHNLSAISKFRQGCLGALIFFMYSGILK